MNFFEAQAKARRNTSRLIILFALAVSGLILLSNMLLLAIVAFNQTGFFVFSPAGLLHYFSWDIFIVATAGICILILGGSLYKTLSLSKGGPAVAEMLGGRLVPQSTGDFRQKRLLNVVEEMAIAAGMPVPKVYLLDETSINAFAAGLSPATAVIGITQGCLDLLTREELQGVIAHEFSHILNGDMRLNIRLTGLLHGILIVGIIGYYIVRSLRFSGRSRSGKGGSAIVGFFALGIGLMVIGYSGTFFGQWIKAVVSRQREYLADSSAVQFTRNKDSIAGALKKIGGTYQGSTLESSAAPEYSHAFFANGISSFWQSLFATHPPIEKRIKSIDPSWDGEFVSAQQLSQDAESEETSVSAQNNAQKIALTAAILSSAEQAISQVGTLNEANVEYVHQLIGAMPDSLRYAAQSAYSARAVVYFLLIRQQENNKQMLSLLDQYADKNMAELTLELYHSNEALDERFKLPLLDLCINALRELSTNQYIQFEECINKIISADKKVDLNEWVIQRLVLQQLDQHFGFRKTAKSTANLDSVESSIEVLLSLIAYVEHQEEKLAGLAFNIGKKEAGFDTLNLKPREALTLELLNKSLDSLMQLKPLLKPRLLKAIAAAILADNKTTTRGVELIRTISSCLDCPMPPLMISNEIKQQG